MNAGSAHNDDADAASASQELKRVHDEMERVFNVRIKPARDGAKPSESVPKSKLQAKITLCRSARAGV